MIKQFEASMSELETLVEALEKGDLSLEDSLSQFEKGIGLVKKCTQTLNKAEQKLKKLTTDNELESLIVDEE